MSIKHQYNILLKKKFFSLLPVNELYSPDCLSLCWIWLMGWLQAPFIAAAVAAWIILGWKCSHIFSCCAGLARHCITTPGCKWGPIEGIREGWLQINQNINASAINPPQQTLESPSILHCGAREPKQRQRRRKKKRHFYSTSITQGLWKLHCMLRKWWARVGECMALWWAWACTYVCQWAEVHVQLDSQCPPLFCSTFTCAEH